METENTPKKTIWQQIVAVCKNPISVISDKTKDSPIITILAIVFILQPVLSTGFTVVKDLIDVKQSLNPSNRPVTKAELDIVNTKIDFIQQLIVTDMQNDGAAAKPQRHERPAPVAVAPPVSSPPQPIVTAPAPVAVVPPPVVSSSPKATDIRSRFGELNKRLEVIQAPLNELYMKNKKQ